MPVYPAAFAKLIRAGFRPRQATGLLEAFQEAGAAPGGGGGGGTGGGSALITSTELMPTYGALRVYTANGMQYLEMGVDGAAAWNIDRDRDRQGVHQGPDINVRAGMLDDVRSRAKDWQPTEDGMYTLGMSLNMTFPGENAPDFVQVTMNAGTWGLGGVTETVPTVTDPARNAGRKGVQRHFQTWPYFDFGYGDNGYGHGVTINWPVPAGGELALADLGMFGMGFANGNVGLQLILAKLGG